MKREQIFLGYVATTYIISYMSEFPSCKICQIYRAQFIGQTLFLPC
jgi:hypothetical protein